MSFSRSNPTNNAGEVQLSKANPEIEDEKSDAFTSHPSRHCKIPSILSNISKRNLSIDSWYVDLPELSQIQREGLNIDIRNDEVATDVCEHQEGKKKRIFEGVEGRPSAVFGTQSRDLASQNFVKELSESRSTPRHKIFDMNSPRREEYHYNKLENSGKKFSEKTNLIKVEPHFPPMNEEVSLQEESRYKERTLSSFGLQENSFQNSLSIFQGIQKKMISSENRDLDGIRNDAFEMSNQENKHVYEHGYDPRQLVSFGSFLNQKKIRSKVPSRKNGLNQDEKAKGKLEEEAEKSNHVKADNRLHESIRSNEVGAPSLKKDSQLESDSSMREFSNISENLVKSKQYSSSQQEDSTLSRNRNRATDTDKLGEDNSDTYKQAKALENNSQHKLRQNNQIGVDRSLNKQESKVDSTNDHIGTLVKNLNANFENLLRKKEIIERKSDEKTGIMLKRSDTSYYNNALSTTGDEKLSCKSLDGMIGKQGSFQPSNLAKVFYNKMPSDKGVLEIRAFETFHQNKNFSSEPFRPAEISNDEDHYFLSGKLYDKNISIGKIFNEVKMASNFQNSDQQPIEEDDMEQRLCSMRESKRLEFLKKSECHDPSQLTYREPLLPAKPELECQERKIDFSYMNISCQNISYLSDINRPDLKIAEQVFFKTDEHIESECGWYMDNHLLKSNILQSAEFLISLPDFCRTQSEKVIQNLLSRIKVLESASASASIEKAQEGYRHKKNKNIRPIRKRIEKKKAIHYKKKKLPLSGELTKHRIKKDAVVKLKLGKNEINEDDIFSSICLNERIHFTSEEESFNDSQRTKSDNESDQGFTPAKSAPHKGKLEEKFRLNNVRSSYGKNNHSKSNSCAKDIVEARRLEASGRSRAGEPQCSKLSESIQSRIHEDAKMSVSVIKPSTNPFIKTDLKRSQTELIGQSSSSFQSLTQSFGNKIQGPVKETTQKFDFIKAKVQHPLFSKQTTGHVLNKALIEQSSPPEAKVCIPRSKSLGRLETIKLKDVFSHRENGISGLEISERDCKQKKYESIMLQRDPVNLSKSVIQNAAAPATIERTKNKPSHIRTRSQGRMKK